MSAGTAVKRPAGESTGMQLSGAQGDETLVFDKQ